MAIIYLALALLVHTILMALGRATIRRRHFAFFQAHRRARGKPASYGHFLLYYVSWLDPALYLAASGRPGFREDQRRAGLLYLAGLAVVAGLVVWAV